MAGNIDRFNFLCFVSYLYFGSNLNFRGNQWLPQLSWWNEDVINEKNTTTDRDKES